MSSAVQTKKITITCSVSQPTCLMSLLPATPTPDCEVLSSSLTLGSRALMLLWMALNQAWADTSSFARRNKGIRPSAEHTSRYLHEESPLTWEWNPSGSPGTNCYMQFCLMQTLPPISVHCKIQRSTNSKGWMHFGADIVLRGANLVGLQTFQCGLKQSCALSLVPKPSRGLFLSTWACSFRCICDQDWVLCPVSW